MSVAVITGSAGLIGSETCKRFAAEGFHVAGIDNDMRAEFFGTEASTAGTRAKLEDSLATNERVCVVFKVGCQRAARVPEEMTLLGDMSTLDGTTL